jgi:O-antigen/teichoic acid export membrane protein
MPNLKRLMTDGLWVTGGSAMMVISAVAINMLLARLLSPEDMGKYFLTVSVVAVAATLAQLGLAQTAVREVAAALGAGDAMQVQKVVRDVVRWGSLSTVSIGAVSVLAGSMLGFQLGFVLIAIVWMGMRAWQNLLAEVLRGFQDIRAATIFGGVLTNVVNVGFLAIAWIIYGHFGLNSALILLAVGGVVTVILAAWGVSRKLMAHLASARPLNPQSRPHILSQSWPILINNLVWLVLGQMDIWILSAFRSPAEVAIYGVATRLATYLTLPQNVTKSVVSPRIAELYVQERGRELERLVRGAATLASVIALMVGLTYILAGEPLLGVLFGDFYRTGAMALSLLTLGQVIGIGAGLAATTMIMTGHQLAVMLVSIVRGLFTAVACILLVPAHGMLGVAGAIGGGIAIQNIVMLLVAKRTVGVWTYFSPDLRSLFRYGQILINPGKRNLRA